ncbi:hypothetical protein [Hydrogenophaga sp.]|uniref:hypothetical protein n=1 Tax=Hydrogenophaga sp. TaxID=1904254 RepID=UPI003D2A7CB3
MYSPLYTVLKGQAYDVLATIASCDHQKAAAKGYRDGWQMLMDLHDENEMAVFCAALPGHLSEAQSKILLDGLAREYTSCDGWMAYVDRCGKEPSWKPSTD